MRSAFANRFCSTDVKRRLGGAVAALLMLLAPLVSADEQPDVEQPARAFGHVIGDVLLQRLAWNDDDDLDAWSKRLPEGRVGPWLERLPLSLEQDQSGQRWLVVGYQIVNAPDTLVETSLPSIESGESTLVEPWPFTLAALTPLVVTENGELMPMQAGSSEPPLNTAGNWRRLVGALSLLAAVLAGWLGWWWWREQRDKVQLPFARARASIAALPGSSVDTNPQAWHALHAALNRTADKSLSTKTLPLLFARAPWLQPLQDRIEAFHAASDARFFVLPPEPGAFPLKALCRDLSRAERRQAR